MTQSHVLRSALLLALCALADGVAAATWNTDTGVWNDPLNWLPVAIPGAADDVFVNDPSQVETISITVAAAFRSLTIADGSGLVPDSVTQQNAVSVIANGGGIVNDGVYFMNAGPSLVDLTFVGAQSITGIGTLLMSDSANNRILTNNTVLTLGNGLDSPIIRGAGQLLVNTGGLVNRGLVAALGSVALTINPNGLGVVNHGTLRGEGSAGLVLTDGSFTNNGVIEAVDGSQVVMTGATVTGGVLRTSGSGVLKPQSAVLDGVTVEGLIEQTNGISNIVRNGLTLNGTWSMLAAGSLVDVTFDGAQTVAGNGLILMSNSPNNRLLTTNDVLTLGSGMELRGAGQVLVNSGGLINQGTLRADQVTALTINPNGLGFVNEGLVLATGSGGITLIDGEFTNTGHSIDVATGSRLDLSGAVLVGGTLTTAGTGVIAPQSSVFDGVTIAGVVTQGNGISNTVQNGLTLNGVWNLNAGPSLVDLTFDGSQTIAGTGELVLSDSPNNRLLNTNDVTTLGAGVTLRGAGQLLANGGGLLNLGTIDADHATALTINPNALGFTNQGTLLARGAGGLVFVDGVFTLTDHAVDVLDGSKLLLNGATVIGGELNTAGTGVVNAQFSLLNGVTVNGAVAQANAISNTVQNGLTLNGVWNLNAGPSLVDLTFDGSQTIAGTGELVLSDSPNNRLLNTNDVTTLGAGVTLRGAGQLLANGGGLLNLGTIDADRATALTIDPNANGFVNEGTLLARGAGGLVFVNGVFTLTDHAVDVLNGSKLLLSSATVIGGDLNTLGTGVVNAQFSTLSGVTVNGAVAQANGISNTVQNGLTLNGVWNLNAGASLVDLTFDGSQTIAGTGELVLSDSVNNRLLNTNDVTTLGADLSVRGAGQLLANTGGLLNLGTIDADQASALTIDPNALGFENRGQLIARGTGGLVSVDSLRQTAGSTTVLSSLQVQTGSFLLEGGTLRGDGTLTGTVLNSGGSVAPGLSPGTLDIAGTYTQQAGGTLALELASDTLFDLLEVSGTAMLGGTLAVDLLGNYTPAIGTTFDVLTAASIVGNFANGLVDAGRATFSIAIIDGVGLDVVRLTTATVVPVPGGVWLFAPVVLVLLRARSLRPTARANSATTLPARQRSRRGG